MNLAPAMCLEGRTLYKLQLSDSALRFSVLSHCIFSGLLASPLCRLSFARKKADLEPLNPPCFAGLINPCTAHMAPQIYCLCTHQINIPQLTSTTTMHEHKRQHHMCTHSHHHFAPHHTFSPSVHVVCALTHTYGPKAHAPAPSVAHSPPPQNQLLIRHTSTHSSSCSLSHSHTRLDLRTASCHLG